MLIETVITFFFFAPSAHRALFEVEVFFRLPRIQSMALRPYLARSGRSCVREYECALRHTRDPVSHFLWSIMHALCTHPRTPDGRLWDIAQCPSPLARFHNRWWVSISTPPIFLCSPLVFVHIHTKTVHQYLFCLPPSFRDRASSCRSEQSGWAQVRTIATGLRVPAHLYEYNKDKSLSTSCYTYAALFFEGSPLFLHSLCLLIRPFSSLP